MTFSFQMVQLICICGMEGSFLKKSGTHGKDAKKKINSFESIFCLSNISSIRFNWFCRVFLKQILFFNLSMLHVLTACFAQSCAIMCFSFSEAWTISKRKKILESKCYCTCYCLHVLNIVLNTAFDLESIDFSNINKHIPRKTAIVQRGVTCSYYWRPHWCSFFFSNTSKLFYIFHVHINWMLRICLLCIVDDSEKEIFF